MEELRNVIDANGCSHEIDRLIGEGGQGRIYLLKNGRQIVKLYTNRQRITSVKSDINYLIRLGLNKRRYAVPLLEVVSPCPGYIADFASGMMSLTELKWSNQTEDFAKWLKATGGTAKRYRVLANLAYLLRSLHSSGLTYCDLSPNNIFVSKDPDNNEVFLIDMDNVRHRTGIVHTIYTPFYGAPEVVSGKDANTAMSDCFSFAVIAYELLTAAHPLIGDYVDEDAEREADALEGKIPWVENPDDTINERSTGIPSKVFVSPKLSKLFHRTFEQGLNAPERRPDMFDWYEALCSGTDSLLCCPRCGIEFPYVEGQTCPACGEYTPDKVFHIQMRMWDETSHMDNDGKPKFGLSPNIFDDIVIDVNTRKQITSAHFLCSLSDKPEPILKIVIQDVLPDGNPKIAIRPEDGKTLRMYSLAGIPNAVMPLINRGVLLSTYYDRMFLALNELGKKSQMVMTIK